MAKEQRRLPGALGGMIVDLLLSAGRPMSGYFLTLELGLIGHRVFSTQVFRSINQLCDQEKIHRIELMNSYVPGPPWQAANLVCRVCGSLAQIPVPAVFGELEALAVQRGMRVHRTIVESTGLCEECRTLA